MAARVISAPVLGARHGGDRRTPRKRWPASAGQEAPASRVRHPAGLGAHPDRRQQEPRDDPPVGRLAGDVRNYRDKFPTCQPPSSSICRRTRWSRFVLRRKRTPRTRSPASSGCKLAPMLKTEEVRYHQRANPGDQPRVSLADTASSRSAPRKPGRTGSGSRSRYVKPTRPAYACTFRGMSWPSIADRNNKKIKKATKYDNEAFMDHSSIGVYVGASMPTRSKFLRRARSSRRAARFGPATAPISSVTTASGSSTPCGRPVMSTCVRSRSRSRRMSQGSAVQA